MVSVSPAQRSVEQNVMQGLETVLIERAQILARETGAIIRQRTFTGATLVQTLVFGWHQLPAATLEQLVSMAASAEVLVSDTSIHDRLTPQTAELLRRVLEEMTTVVIEESHGVEVVLLKAFEAVILEDSSVIRLPPELAEVWQATGNQHTEKASSLKVHVRWERQRGRLDGPALTDGKTGDQNSPWAQAEVQAGALYVQDLGYFNIERFARRPQAGAFTLTRWRTRTCLMDRQGCRLPLGRMLPKQVGQWSEIAVLVGQQERLPMRLLMLKVPPEVAHKRREHLEAEAKRRGQAVSQEAWDLAAWTLLLTDAPRQRLSVGQACVLLRERWQMEILYKEWKRDGLVDEWRTKNAWRILCEVYAKLIGLLVQHWMMVLYAWQDVHRSLFKVAAVCRDTCAGLMEALAGFRPLREAMHSIARRLQAGCRMTTHRKRPSSAQLLQEGLDWALLAP